MRKRYLFLYLAVIIIITGVLVWACKDPTTGPGAIERQKDGVDKVDGVDKADDNKSYTLNNGQLFSSSYQIPALTVSANNVIIAAAGVSSGNGKVLIKKSSDNGTTWSDVTAAIDGGYSYPFFINSHNGDILLGVTTTGVSKNSQTIFYKSSDNGATWSKENNTININSISNAATDGYATHGQGIALRHGGNSGSQKLMFPYFYNAPNGNNHTGFYVGIMYSENGGSFSQVCEIFTNGGNPTTSHIGSFGSYPSKLIELDNGDILLNMRTMSNYGQGYTFWMLSKDCGKNWDITVSAKSDENKDGKGAWAKHADFIRYEFNGKDIKTEYNKHALMICSYETKTGYSIMMTTNDFNHGKAEGGTNMKYASTKELQSSKTGGYPAITVLSNGTIATLTEENNGIVFKTHSYDGGKLN